ncbi:hypothetical protein H0Z60_13030 [Ectothiorhodospiraceae bacterium WFHF3C12]|nr:hypothetical protein [Ectothiorhodospiraceae bacterium WFHF3C12]
MNVGPVPVANADAVTSEYSRFGPRKLEEHLAGFSKGNPGLYATELGRLLTALNGSRLERMDRLVAMERLRPPVLDTCDTLVQGYRNLSLPLPEQAQQAAAATTRLLALLNEGYKLSVNQRLAAREHGEPSHGPPLKLALQRALLVGGRSLLEHYRLYAPEPTDLWRDVHCLYLNAEALKLQAQPFEAEGDRDETALAIKQAYLRMVVLALANPHHLLQGEAAELYRRIGRWVHLVRLVEPHRWQELPGQFVVDLCGSLPPHYRSRERRLPTPDLPRIIQLDQLVAAVDDRLESLEGELAERPSRAALGLRMQRNMYLRFREALGGRQERVDTRRTTVARVSVVAGLSGCHFFLNGRRSFNPDADEARWTQRLNGITEQTEPALTLSDSEYLTDPVTPAEPEGRRSAFRARDPEVDDVWRRAHLVGIGESGAGAQRRAQYRAVTWNRKNVSAGGMALFCVDPVEMRMRVGELMAYSDDGNAPPQAWKLAQVRWLRTRPDGGLEAGVRNVADSGYAVGTKAVQGAGRDTEYLRGILVPRVNPLTEETTLLAPVGVYEPGTVLRLVMSDLSIYIKLTERVVTSQLFAHFRFRLVQPPAHLRGG